VACSTSIFQILKTAKRHNAKNVKKWTPKFVKYINLIRVSEELGVKGNNII